MMEKLEMKHKSYHQGRLLQRFIPARVLFVALGFFGFFLVYAYKVVLSMAIVAMVKSDHSSSPIQSSTPIYHNFSTITLKSVHDSLNNESCPGTEQTTKQDGEFDWPDSTKNAVLASFFYGYVITQFPAGIIATKYGGKWIFGCSLLIAAIGSLLSPWAARKSYVWFMAIRVIQGLAEGVVFPCMNTMIAKWMPKYERTRGTTIIFSGCAIGTVATLPMAAQFNESKFGWQASFYFLGITGIVWFILYCIFVYESPETHPFISQKEHDYILMNGGGKQIQINAPVPYYKIFTSVPVYGLILTCFGQNWAFLIVLTYMPTYMSKVLHTNNQQNTIISGMPYLGQAIFGWICSYVTDKVRASGRFEITTIRKTNGFIAYIPPALCIALVPYAGCDQTLCCALLILAITMNGACLSSCNSTHIDMAPDFAGTLMGLTNGIANMPGFLVPKVVQAFTNQENTVKSWSMVFYSAVIVNVLTTIIYTFLCTAKEQSWGRIRKS